MFNADAFVLTNRKLAIGLAALNRLPAIYGIPTGASEGSLIYYCLDIFDQYRQAVTYIDRILKGGHGDNGERCRAAHHAEGDGGRWYSEVVSANTIVARGVADIEPEACRRAHDAGREANPAPT